MPIPKAIVDAPQLRTDLILYFNVFLKLSSCRPSGFDEGRIPWTAVAELCRHYGWGDFEEEVMWAFISEMDNSYLEYRRSKQPGNGGPIAQNKKPVEPRIVRRAR